MARRTAARRRPAPRVRPKLPFSREEMDTPPSQIRDNEFDTQQDNNETKDEVCSPISVWTKCFISIHMFFPDGLDW